MNCEKNSPRLVLASGSPRRHELLAKMGYTFDICTPDVDENVSGHARDIVATLSERKAEAAASHYESGIIIASDTLVSLDGIPLGKPENEADAHRILRMLSGREHEVFTGVCLIDVATGKEEVCLERSGVLFRDLTDEEIDRYIATGEPADKAGAYAIQGLGGAFVARFDGSYENIVGFPVKLVSEMLQRFGF